MTVTVRALRADETCYRWWTATIERAAGGLVVTRNAPGHRVEGPGGGWISRHAIRAFYWLDRPYNLLEVYRPDGSLEELYVHIASPATIDGHEIRYTDHELDVVRRAGEAPVVVDEDDFARAVIAYQHTPAFQAARWAAVREALQLVEQWTLGGS